MRVSPNETFQAQVDKRRVKKRSAKQEMKYLDRDLSVHLSVHLRIMTCRDNFPVIMSATAFPAKSTTKTNEANHKSFHASHHI